jgi:hypothetical protein
MRKFELHNGVYSTVIALIAAGILAINPRAAWIGYPLVLLATLLLLWGVRYKNLSILDLVKGKAHIASLFRDRTFFSREIIDLTKLVGGDHFLTGKSFDSCILHFPNVKFQMRNHIYLCSMSNSNWDVLPEQTPINGVLIFIDCKFERCLFDSTTFVGTKIDYEQIAHHVNETSVKDWKTEQWH